jgi:DNA-binding transcriptional MerR regulator
MAIDRGVGIGAAAREAGVGAQTLHYYERRGLLPRPVRTAAGYRRYTADDIGTVRAIKRAQSLGFTLDQIRELMAMRRSGDARRVASTAAAKLREIDEKLRDLRRMRASLAKLVESCRCGGDLRRCDVLEGLGGAASSGGAQ